MATAASEKSVQQLYIAYFGRPADPTGLAFYADPLDAGTVTLADIADSFALSPEAAAIVALDTDAFLTSIYQNAFGRTYDNSEAVDGTFWADAIDAGTVTKEQAMVEILGGASAVDLAASDNKAEVAATYTAAVTADGATYTTDEIAAAQAILTAVTDDAATLAAGNTAAAAEVAANVPNENAALITAAADAKYAELVISGDATPAEIAVAAALTLTTAEAAIAAGATQEEINAEYDVLVAAGADEIAAAAAAALKLQIIALDEADSAVVSYLQANTVDTSDPLDGIGDGVDSELSDNATAADVVAAAATGVVDGLIDSADTEAGTSYSATDYSGATDGVKAAILVDVTAGLAANLVAETAAQAVAQVAVDAITGLQTAIDVSNAAAAVKVTTDAAVTAADAAETQAEAEWDAIATIQTDVDTIDATTGVLSVAYNNGAGIMTDDYAIVLTELVDGVIVVRAAADVAEDGTNAAELAFVEALLSHSTVTAFVAAYNTSEAADDADSDADDDVTDAGTALAAVVPGDTTDTDAATALSGAIADTATAQGLVDALAAAAAAEVVADDAAAVTQAIDDALTALELVASTAATALVGELQLNGGGGDSLAANTLAMISDLVTGDAADVDDFDVATDSLYFGDDYTVNSGALATGDNTVLEMFITEGATAADSLITFETAVFGSASSVDFFTVELTGVAVAELTIVDGLIIGA